MKTLDDAFLAEIKEKISYDETDEVLDDLKQFLQPMMRSRDYDDLILITANFNRLERQKRKGQLTDERLSVERNKINDNIISFLNDYYRRSRRKERPFESPATGLPVQEQQPEELTVEALIGKSDLNKISWLARGMKAARSVCFVRRADRATGTGFLLKGGYLLTNNHVLPDVNTASLATISFDYEEDVQGQTKKSVQYNLLGDTLITNPKLDFSLVKVQEEGAETPLSTWGTVELAVNHPYEVGDYVTIVQHPSGRTKELAIDRIATISNPFLRYKTDTEGGSSGSPVFNPDWKVIALHHGAIQNVANQGTRIEAILEALPNVQLV